MIHQDAAHERGGHGEEVGPVPPLDPALIDDLQVRFVDERTGAKARLRLF